MSSTTNHEAPVLDSISLFSRTITLRYPVGGTSTYQVSRQASIRDWSRYLGRRVQVDTDTRRRVIHVYCV